MPRRSIRASTLISGPLQRFVNGGHAFGDQAGLEHAP